MRWCLDEVNFTGYVVYRNGVLYNNSDIWHTGIMDVSRYDYTGLPVIEISGFGTTVQQVSWATFLGGGTYKGVYKPTSAGLVNTDKIKIRDTARSLFNKSIDYTVAYQLEIKASVLNNSSRLNTKLQSSDIDAMRCDGVVEYAYEYNNIRIFGDNNYWNISIVSIQCQNHHNIISITPNKQANYFVKLTDQDIY